MRRRYVSFRNEKIRDIDYREPFLSFSPKAPLRDRFSCLQKDESVLYTHSLIEDRPEEQDLRLEATSFLNLKLAPWNMS